MCCCGCVLTTSKTCDNVLKPNLCGVGVCTCFECILGAIVVERQGGRCMCYNMYCVNSCMMGCLGVGLGDSRGRFVGLCLMNARGGVASTAMGNAIVQLKLVLLLERLWAAQRCIGGRLMAALIVFAGVMPQGVQQQRGLGVVGQNHASISRAASFAVQLLGYHAVEVFVADLRLN